MNAATVKQQQVFSGKILVMRVLQIQKGFHSYG